MGSSAESSNYGDSFVKVFNTGSALQVSNYFSPGDQYYRANSACGGNGDTDFGSGAPMLVPDGENSSYPYLAVSGEKEGGIWFMDRTNPGAGGSTTCTNNSNTNVQTFPFSGSGSVGNGPHIHTSPAFWQSTVPSGDIAYLFLGSQNKPTGSSDAGYLLRYQICNTGNPISSSSPCVQTNAYAYEQPGNPPSAIDFKWGTTPSVTARNSSTYVPDALLWTIWADGSVIPNSKQFTYSGNTFSPASYGKLYAFDAASSSDPNMPKLYSSEDCVMTVNGQQLSVDRINPATKYSVPTVANGYAYVGTQGTLQDPTQCSPANDPTASCFNAGTFYIFGTFTNRQCQ